MEKQTRLVAIAAIIVVIIVAVAVIVTNGGNDSSKDDEPETVSITQNDGKIVEVAVPVQKICIVNTNAAEFATILGVSDRVVGVSSSMIKTPVESWWAERENIGEYKTPSADAILNTGATVVVGQCTSMGITNVESLESQGITVILLDMYGYDTQTEDLKQFAKLFPDTDAMDIAEKYDKFFSGIVDDISSKTAGVADEDRMTFLSTMGTKADSKYYSTKAELSNLLTDICGMKNSTGNLVENPKSSNVNIDEASIIEEYNKNGIDMFILRNTTSYEEAPSDIESFLSSHPMIDAEGMFDEMTVIKTVDSKCLSGARCFISMVYFASLANPTIDFGMTVDSVVKEYNSLFGTSWSSEKLFYEA